MTDDPSNPARISILLGAGDTVTCTYTNSPSTTLNGLFVRKVSLGGVDTFRYTARDSGSDVVSEPSVTTTEEGIAAGRAGAGRAGRRTYTLEEDLPDSDVGEWALESVTCTGGQSGPFPLGKVTVPDQGAAACTFRNRFTPAGRIRIFKRTLGGTARPASRSGPSS